MAGYRFVTLGCRLNQAESDLMAEELAGAGLVPAVEGDEADLVVVNTCTVTKEATKASRTALRRAVKNNRGARVVAIGCYVESDPEEVAAVDGVDITLGNAAKEAFVEALVDGSGGSAQAGPPGVSPLLQIGGIGAATSRSKQRSGSSSTSAPASGSRVGQNGSKSESASAPAPKVRANLKVQTGCDEWCTFCIIPKTRGPLRSMDEDTLIAEARRRVEEGTRELVLTGVHLGKYRFDKAGDERDLIRLIERCLAIEGVQRLRLSSILSDHLTDDVIDLIAAEPRICRYLHVPLQAGHDEILAAMHRPYRIAAYIERVVAARARIPGLALATDVIVGFPGETEERFQATLDVVARLAFSKLHVFRYSPRAGTAAATMPDEAHPDVKKDRSKRLIALGNRLRRQFLDAHLGRPLEVLVEDERIVDRTSVCSGQTSDYVRVWFEGRGLLGRMVEVIGHEVRADGIRGGTLTTVCPAG